MILGSAGAVTCTWEDTSADRGGISAGTEGEGMAAGTLGVGKALGTLVEGKAPGT